MPYLHADGTVDLGLMDDCDALAISYITESITDFSKQTYLNPLITPYAELSSLKA